MKLTLDNVGKISHAEITVSGLTVIAAPNNTGKSTIGKALFAAFDAFVNFQANVQEDQANSIARVLYQKYPLAQEERLVRGSVRNPIHSRRIESAGMVLARYLVQMRDQYLTSDQDLVEALRQYAEDPFAAQYTDGRSYLYFRGDKEKFTNTLKSLALDLAQDSKESGNLRSDILDYLNVNVHILSMKLVGRYFTDFFSGQFSSKFSDSPKRSSLVLNNNQGDVIRRLEFQNGECIEASPTEDERHRVFILDDPRIPELFGHGHLGARSDTRYVRRLLEAVDDKQKQVEDNPASGLTETVSNEDAVRQIIEMLDSSFSGRIEFDDKGYPVLSTDASVQEPIKLENASMGVKAYAALRYLIENAIVHDGDVLVLDEPEIHLHPEWQVAYAHALVLTAKLLGVRLIITTHSPFFLKALVAYSGTEGIGDVTHYYTAKENLKGPVSFHEIWGEGIAELYARMAEPLMKIDNDVNHD